MTFSSIDNSYLNKMALTLGLAFFGVLLAAIVIGRLLLLKIPRGLVSRIMGVLGAVGFIFLIAFLADRLF
ncbi:hypothetical protein C2I06_12550 [Niallia circulans]|uniref:hypothetical protein n=1 Tax=Niallia circulans TaxID=1397 RepID=UPI000F455C1E|nr:hypothetical protein [Niallia circulans]AYV67630.1 hypothetical protein C2I06_12550 [Niallia circulans]